MWWTRSLVASTEWYRFNNRYCLGNGLSWLSHNTNEIRDKRSGLSNLCCAHASASIRSCNEVLKSSRWWEHISNSPFFMCANITNQIAGHSHANHFTDFTTQCTCSICTTMQFNWSIVFNNHSYYVLSTIVIHLCPGCNSSFYPLPCQSIQGLINFVSSIFSLD